MLHELRTFHRRVLNDEQAPHTYRGYAEAAMAIVRPAIRRLAEIEAEMIKQGNIPATKKFAIINLFFSVLRNHININKFW